MTLLPEHTTARATAPDGVAVAVQDWGAPTGAGRAQDVLFLHGFSQSHSCWLHQIASPLAQRYRLVTYDLRGHGDSDKPGDALYYQDPRRWADEVNAVIGQAKLLRPTIVAWSYAGRIILDYLSVYGDGALSSLVLVNATTSTDPAVFGPAARLLREMGDVDPAVSEAATRELLKACVAHPLPDEELQYMLQYNRKVPPRVRANLRRPPRNYEPVLNGLRVPVLVVHGALDPIQLPAMAAHTASQIRHARLSIYDDAAHMPFWEQPARFNAQLDEFIQLRVTRQPA